MGDARKGGGSARDNNLLDMILHEPQLARLYWGMARMDAETQVAIPSPPA